jgi:hypothetical protein
VEDLEAFKRDVESDMSRALGPDVRSVKVLRLLHMTCVCVCVCV